MELWNLITLGVLVIITGYYAYQTKGMLQEMKEARKAQFLPKLKLSLELFSFSDLITRVTNVGVGPAINPKIEIWISPGNETEKKSFQTQLMATGEYQDFLDYLIPTEELPKNWEILRLRGKYKDVYGGNYEVEDEIDLKEYTTMLKKSSAYYQGSQRDEIKKIRRVLEKIRNSLG